MAKGENKDARREERRDSDGQEAEALLSSGLPDHDSDIVVSVGPPPRPVRQSSMSRVSENGEPRTPRTPNRVRFDIDDRLSEETANGHAEGWLDDEDYLAASRQDGRSGSGQRAPLLTDIEAPSVALASADLDFDAEDLLESARPKSGMRSAFMNMANSIIGAGIIGDDPGFMVAKSLLR
ncbi:MAG: hypothetical protein M1827_002859 [Pycnora praestabilis]|nr:MAG: hypothetical protein M1827_002859 [Pycnora praestabilis]